jgi:hypothetical protein
MKSILSSAVLACTLAALGKAQTPPLPPYSAAECQYAAQSLGNTPLQPSKWARIAECGQTGATALASAINAAHAQSDMTFLRTLLFAGSHIRDQGVSDASIALIQDRSGTVAARMVGMLIAVSQREAGMTLGSANWASAVTVPMGNACQISRSREYSAWASDLGLQAGAIGVIATALGAVSADATEPPVIRDFARCLGGFWSDVPQVVNTSLITVAYVCGQKYKVTNASPFRVTVGFQLFHSAERGELSVPANGEEFIVTHNPYGFDLLYQGQIIGQAQNGLTGCPP